MERVSGKVTRVNQRNNGYGVIINDEWYGGLGQCPYKEGDDVSRDFVFKESGGKTYRNFIEEEPVGVVIKPQMKPQTEHPVGNLDLIQSILEMQMTPKLHVGLVKEVDDKIIKCGSYDKVIVKTYSVNITIPLKTVEELDIDKIKELQKMAEDSVEEQINPCPESCPEKDEPKEEKKPEPNPEKKGSATSKIEEAFINAD